MILQAKTFDELSKEELFAILRARQDVFVVEQECAYHDIDDIDLSCVHVFAMEGEKLVACLRYFPMEEDPEVIRIGRVLTTVRHRGYGEEIMKYALKTIPEKRLYLEAQVYAIGFYEEFGFRVDSEPFDEDGIPHVKMRLDRDQSRQRKNHTRNAETPANTRISAAAEEDVSCAAGKGAGEGDDEGSAVTEGAAASMPLVV